MNHDDRRGVTAAESPSRMDQQIPARPVTDQRSWLWGLVKQKRRGLERPSFEEELNGTSTPPYYWGAFVLSDDWR